MDDKNPNRTIRNDIAGHPIRRKGKHEEKSRLVKSYSIFSYEATKSKIQFAKYRQVTGFKFELEEHYITEVISRHQSFLLKNINLIFNKALSVLKKFSCFNHKLLEIKDKITFHKLVDQTEIRFNNFFRQDNAFRKEYIKSCWDKKEVHPRYQYAVKKFIIELTEMITEVIKNITELEKEWNIDKYAQDLPSIPIIVDILDRTNPSSTDNSPFIEHYDLSKLRENHPIFGIDYFKEKFSGDSKIIDELNNMENHVGQTEFYCSYNYLTDILLKDIIRE